MKRSIFSLLLLMLVASACDRKDNPDTPEVERYYANTFAYNVLKTYYLWVDEASVSSKMADWSVKADPMEKVASVLYSADKWTSLMEDYSAFESSVTGSGKTFGLDFDLYYANQERTKVCAIVTYTYADSPARAAGLKRGDDIRQIDGQEMLKENYKTLLGKLYSASSIELGLNDGRSVKMASVQMYENPVHTAITLEHGGKKVGYLHFTNFTLDACKDLETAFAQFKADGIRDLILDLRYNSGGYVTTATALASMIAPSQVVSEKKIFIKDVYNKFLTENLDDKETFFQSEITYKSNLSGKDVTVHPLEVNPGIGHLWVLVSGDSASASESLICGLKPYMDVTLIGENTYGKYCGGILIKAKDWYELLEKEKAAGDIDCKAAIAAVPTWGMYVITSRYADCNGQTLSMPDGIAPDLQVRDTPADGVPLGDPAEALLAAALDATKAAPALRPEPRPAPLRRPGFGVLLH